MTDSVHIWHARDGDCIDTNLPMLNLDEARLTKVFCPLVLQFPVEAFDRVLAVADKFHCMTTNILSNCVLVDPALVIEKILINRQAHEHWAIRNKFALNLIIVHGQFQRTWLAEVLFVIVTSAIRALIAA